MRSPRWHAIFGFKPKPRTPLIEKHVDFLIEQMAKDPNKFDAYEQRRRAVIMHVFENGEAFVDMHGNIVPKGDPSAVTHMTFDLIKATMMKLYGQGD